MRHIKQELVTFIDQHIGATPPTDPSALFRAALVACQGVHEQGGNNRGHIVELIQSTAGSPVAQPWCMDFMQCGIAYVEVKLGLVCPLPVTESTYNMLDWAKQHGMLHSSAVPGDLVLWNHYDANWHLTGGHVGCVLKNGDMLETVEGNTSGPSNAVVREGDVVAVKLRSPVGNQAMKVMGFVPVTFHAKVA